MKTIIKNKSSFSQKEDLILLCEKKNSLSNFNFSEPELNHIKSEWRNKKEIVLINQYQRLIFIVKPTNYKNKNKYIESLRLIGDQLQNYLQEKESILLIDLTNSHKKLLAITEGIALANYTFTRHKTAPKETKLKNIYLKDIEKKYIVELQNVIDSVYLTKDLINEPFSHLKATDLSNTAIKSVNKYGVKTTVFNKKKIESLKMGGLLAVNQGSIDEPTFTILEWKPKKATNKRPIILVGKGIVYDTGGLSLKPTANSMDLMKIDMGGAGTVIGAIQAIAANKINKHIIGLIPATDNRPSGNAYAPGDVITMHNGTTVEVLNTDAEGRLILADALSFAKQYDPELVIDIATLTGSAVAAIGHYGSVSMHHGAKKDHTFLQKTGDQVHERLAELPFWDDYDELIKSDIADIKNIGGAHSGAITAGKFLAHFINYPWIHIDLAGVYSKTKYGYRGKGATGFGVRLLYEFIKNR